jgi:hypothetical protein
MGEDSEAVTSEVTCRVYPGLLFLSLFLFALIDLQSGISEFRNGRFLTITCVGCHEHDTPLDQSHCPVRIICPRDLQLYEPICVMVSSGASIPHV